MTDLAAAHPPRNAVERLLRPRSIAIVGASTNREALGTRVLANLRARFTGDIHLINPKRPVIEGITALASVDELPDGVDAAVLAIPRAGVVAAVEALGKRGCGGIVIFSAGFAEAGPEGKADQDRLAVLAQQYGMVIEGPNCLGLVNYVDGIPLTFVETPPAPLHGRQGVGIVSQSGAMAAVVSTALRSRFLDVSFSVSTGNEAASGVEDYVDYLIDDDDTRILTLVVEQFRHPRRFLELARRARERDKLIVLVHPGKSSAARASAATHTGAMAGDYAVMRAMLHHAGVLMVESLEELLDVSELALRIRSLPVAGPVVLGESGWLKALVLDLCEEIGLPLPALTPTGLKGLKEALPDFIPPSNPLDLTAQALVDPDLYRRTLNVLVAEECYGAIVIAIILTDESTIRLKLPPILGALNALESGKPVIFVGVDEGAPMPREYIDALNALHIPFFPSPERGIRALGRLTELARRVLPQIASEPPAAPVLPEVGIVPEYLSKQILAEIGVPIPPGGFVRSMAEAVAVADRIGYPVVLKAQAAALSHKSDAGGVILNLADARAVETGWSQLHANVARAAKHVTLDGVLVEKMGKRGVELIVGARNDPDWGAVVLVGLGGVLAEILHDSRLIPADVDEGAIAAELQKLKSAALLNGYRGSAALDVAAATSLIAKTAGLVRSSPRVREIDVNPVVLYPDGQGVVALDALIALD